MASQSRLSIFGGRRSVSRRSVSGKDIEQLPYLNAEEVQSRRATGPELNFNDANFADYLQHREFEDVIFGNDNPSNFIPQYSHPHPSGALGPSCENPPRPPPPSETVQGPQPDLAKYKSELFKVHMRRVEKESREVVVTCNYCNKDFKWNKSGGYGTYWKHINTKHPVKAQQEHSRGQYQIFKYTSPNHNLFKYNDVNNREQLARIVATEHLSFSFGEKTDFSKYCHNALNPAACRVPRTTLKRIMCDIYKKEKKKH
ncbi:hypothetical protein ACOSP7_028259 [Xanthoceras sorbifolium]